MPGREKRREAGPAAASTGGPPSSKAVQGFRTAFDAFLVAGRLRPPDAEYRLVEIHAADGWCEEEVFRAPDDATAWQRVLEASSGDIVALWQGGRLVGLHPPALVYPPPTLATCLSSPSAC